MKIRPIEASLALVLPCSPQHSVTSFSDATLPAGAPRSKGSQARYISKVFEKVSYFVKCRTVGLVRFELIKFTETLQYADDRIAHLSCFSQPSALQQAFALGADAFQHLVGGLPAHAAEFALCDPPSKQLNDGIILTLSGRCEHGLASCVGQEHGTGPLGDLSPSIFADPGLSQASDRTLAHQPWNLG